MNDTMKLVTDYANFEGTPAQIAQQINDRVVQPLIDFACQRDADFGKRLQESMQAAQQKEGYVLVPVEPTYLMIKRAAESVCKEWEGTPTSLVEFLDFSGENMAHLVIAEALRQAVKAALKAESLERNGK